MPTARPRPSSAPAIPCAPAVAPQPLDPMLSSLGNGDTHVAACPHDRVHGRLELVCVQVRKLDLSDLLNLEREGRVRATDEARAMRIGAGGERPWHVAVQRWERCSTNCPRGSLTCSIVMLPATFCSRPKGVPDPFGTAAAFLMREEQGGVFRMKVNDLSS
eukprot:scaffold6568_cov126-Isochrysis_galbana.AAC.10